MEMCTPFLLSDLDGTDQHFPGERPALLCFVKEDCPTCREVMPLLAALQAKLAATMDLRIIGQTPEGNHTLAQTHGVDVLDDSALKVAFAYSVETVPTLYVTDVQGRLQSTLVGFVRDEWLELVRELLGEAACEALLD